MLFVKKKNDLILINNNKRRQKRGGRGGVDEIDISNNIMMICIGD